MLEHLHVAEEWEGKEEEEEKEEEKEGFLCATPSIHELHHFVTWRGREP